jgi:hypothetical protein
MAVQGTTGCGANLQHLKCALLLAQLQNSATDNNNLCCLCGFNLLLEELVHSLCA